MPEPRAIDLEVFYDYLCPYVYKASVLLDAVRRSGARDLNIRWRYFSLTQVNARVEGWTVWGAPGSEPVRGRLAFKAAEAARRQGRFDDLHMPLLHARHRDRLDVDLPEVVEHVAEAAGLDLERFRSDVADPTILDVLARDHLEGSSQLGVFGTPTFVFADGAAAYVRLSQVLDGQEALDVFDHLVAVAANEPRILEIKRPRKPAPD